ncbi:hypothetical protein NEMBOFW57_004428 [Staphylotrichum longicolle]|uniref:Uncharacterized protein n=1 Tax=Staphylotrichum longicolle TaxID=669026 RepID=A0AAD4F755_9PEZI|nr:hypothetical protein NEMBOFW57_004428 [Staphylotrichum longicolle]
MPVPANGGEVVGGGAGGPEPLWRRIWIPGEVDGRDGPHLRSPPAAEPPHAVRDGCHAMITPAPSLLGRQDQGQIQALSDQLRQLSDQSRSVSQASQQVSQSSQQLSQSLQQATQRLSQTEQQLASARGQQNAAESASRSMSQASADASRRADEAMRSVSESASRALSESMASITRSMGASFSSALSLAGESASAAMRSAASAAQRAQADATVLRNEANTQIQQAQGAALSVTQTALAIVGGIVGSSLLTGVGFVLVLRHRRKKRRQRRRGGSNSVSGNTGYPHHSNKTYSVTSLKKGYATSDDGSSTYSTDDNGFRFPAGSNGDIKRPAPAATATASDDTSGIPQRKTIPSGVGYAVSYYGARPSISAQLSNVSTTTITAGTTKKAPFQFQLGNPPPRRTTPATTAAAATNTNTTTTATVVVGGGKFSLFPSPKSQTQIQNQQQQQQKSTASNTIGDHAGDQERDGPLFVATSASSSAPPGGAAGVGGANGDDDRGQGGDHQRGGQQPRASSPNGSLSLDRWLRDGTDM